MTEQGLSAFLGTVLLVFLSVTNLQAQLWSTDFEGTNANVSLNTTDLGGVGTAGQNEWIINSAYTGGTVGPITVPATPAQPAAITPNSQNYMHIVSQAGQLLVPPIENAHVDTSAPNGETYFTEIHTAVDASALTGVTLDFWFLNNSPAAQAEVYAKDGATGTWTLLANADFTTSLGLAPTWTQTTYQGSVLDGMADIYIGFRFVHNTTGSDQPSFSVDNMSITAPSNVVANVTYPNPLPTVLCTGDTIHFSAQTSPAITSYQWNFNGANNGPQALLGSTVIFEAALVANPTTFTFELIVSDGVTQDVQQFQVTVNPCNDPVLDFNGSPTSICEGSQVTFTNNTIPGSAPIDSIRWNFPGGTPVTSTQNNPTVTYGTSGSYGVELIVYDSNGVYDTLVNNYINVLVCPPPNAEFIATATQLCPGDCIGFIDQSTNMNGAGSTWFWQFPGADSATSTVQNPQNICYQTPGLYEVILTASNINGSDTRLRTGYIQVDSCLAPIARYEVEKDSICQNTCVQFFSTGIREDSLNWQFDGADLPYRESTERNPTVCYSDTGRFNVQLVAVNDYGVDVELRSNFISVAGYPEVDAGPDETIIIDLPTRIEAFGTAPNFIWTPDYMISDVNSRTPTVNPRENTVYYVTNVNAHGCSSTDSLRVLVRQEYYAGVPDIFSPNEDGNNDVLYVKGNGITDVEFYVYNRAGELVFQSFDQKLGWDGKQKGQNVNPGVFMYFAKVTYLNGFEEIIKGDVTLVR